MIEDLFEGKSDRVRTVMQLVINTARKKGHSDAYIEDTIRWALTAPVADLTPILFDIVKQNREAEETDE